MSSLFVKTERGREVRMLQVIVPGLGRKTVRLGDVRERTAQRFQEKVEDLVGCRRLNVAPDPELAKWLSGLDEDVHANLVAAGLAGERNVPAPRAPTLKAFCDSYIGVKKAEIRERSIHILEQTKHRLIVQFGSDRRIDTVTVGDATDWRASMLKEGLSEATVRLHSRNAKAVFNSAIDREVISRNPFRGLPTGAVAANRDFYLTVPEAEKVIAELPGLQWQLLFGLARFGGLRTSSETHTVEWGGVNLKERRLRVYAPKTGSTRDVPIVPRLLELLTEAKAKREPGVDRVIWLSAHNIHRTVENAAKRAGLEPWPATFQTLRRAAATDFASIAPPHAVAAWMGHGIQVSANHYLQVPAELFERVTMGSLRRGLRIAS